MAPRSIPRPVVSVLIIVATLSLLLTACGQPSLSSKLNGVWFDEGLNLYHFDVAAKRYQGAGPLDEWNQDLVIMDQQDNVLTFSTDGKLFTVRFQDDGSIVIRKQGDYDPIPLSRVRDEMQQPSVELIDEKINDGETPPAMP
jgi:hypothetical protein